MRYLEPVSITFAFETSQINISAIPCDIINQSAWSVLVIHHCEPKNFHGLKTCVLSNIH